MSGTSIAGRIVRLGHDVNTDAVLSGMYLNLTDTAALGSHLLESYQPPVADRIVPGTILCAGRSFGSGSSREQAVVALLARGVGAVVAESFARIFFRNAVNLALLAVECPAAWRDVHDGAEVTIYPTAGIITSGNSTWRFTPAPPFIAEITTAGGLEEWTRRRLRAAARGLGPAASTPGTGGER